MESIFLFCFAFGALFTAVTSVASLLGAGLHGLNSHLHLPGSIHANSGHVGHVDSPVIGLATMLNPSAILVGVTLFGAVGFTSLHHYALSVVWALGLAIPVGLCGMGSIGAFIAKLRQDAGTLHETDYVMAGTLAQVTVTIAAGAVGEIMFEMGGVHRSEAARSARGQAIAKGTPVVILAYERGVASVEPASLILEELAPPAPHP